MPPPLARRALRIAIASLALSACSSAPPEETGSGGGSLAAGGPTGGGGPTSGAGSAASGGGAPMACTPLDEAPVAIGVADSAGEAVLELPARSQGETSWAVAGEEAVVLEI